MKISKQGLKKLMEYEGFVPKAYKDPVGYLTIGVGHMLTKEELSSGKIKIGCTYHKWNDGLDDKQARALLDQDADIAETAVNDFVEVPLTQEQFDSLVSFVFNVGVGAFQRSTLLRVLNSKNYHAAGDQFNRWVYAGGKKIKGLINRRKKESEVFYVCSI